MTSWVDDEAGGTVWSDDESGAADGSLTGSEVDVDADKVRVIDATDNRPKLVTVEELLMNTESFTQSGTGATARTVQARLRDWVSVKDFGATGDGSTDDTSAINAAIDAVEAMTTGNSTAGTVYFPQGEYIVSSQILIPNKVRLLGAGKRSSYITAKSTFTTSTPIVRLGSGASYVFDCRVEDMTINCNSVTGSTGIYSTDANEGSGARNALIMNYMSRGVDLDDSGASNFNDHFLFDDVEITCASSATSTVGFRYNGLKQGGQIRRMTVNNNGSTTQTAGVQLLGTGAAGSHVEIIGLNVERHADGLLIDTNAGATASSVTLLTAGTNTVRIVGSQPVMLTGINKGAATNAIKNDAITQSITDARVPMYITSLSGNGYQVYMASGRSVTAGDVVSNDAPVWTIKSTATSAGASLASVQILDGNNDGWKLRFGGTLSGDPLQFLPVAAGTAGGSVFSLYESGAIQALPTSNGPVGTCTLTAGAASTAVSNTSVTANSIIFLFPTSANAAADVGSATGVYISSKSGGTSFTIAHPNNANADKTFNYLILN
jgi:hypothetical protein